MKKKSGKLKIFLISLTVIFLLLGICAVSLKISNVKVIGTKKYTEEQIKDMLFEKPWSSNLIVAYLNDKFKKHIQIPFVEDYKISFQNLNTIEVVVYEKSVIGYVTYMGSNMYFDKDGIIVESTNTVLPGIPWITGLKFGQIILHKPLQIESNLVFGQILNLTQVLNNYNIAVDKIRYDIHNNPTLYLKDIKVVLGDNTNLDGKISELNDQLQVISGRKGTLYLDTYDENKTDLWYSFIQTK